MGSHILDGSHVSTHSPTSKQAFVRAAYPACSTTGVPEGAQAYTVGHTKRNARPLSWAHGP